MSKRTQQRTTRTKPAAQSRGLLVVTLTAEVLGLFMQLLLVWSGYEIVWGSSYGDEATGLRLAWCGLAVIYLGLTLIVLNVLARAERPDPEATRVLVAHPLVRALSLVIGLGASAIGLTVAIDLIFDLGNGTSDAMSEFSAVMAMLLSWAMFNWAYARIFFAHYHRAPKPSLTFPGTDEPRLVDFVYLAFTNATTFAVSDVKVLTTRMRWTIVWHTSMAFFFNALIIALTLNVVTNGTLLTDIFN